MSDSTNSSRSLSEISHLFLSAVRDKAAAGGAARPTRKPPQPVMAAVRPPSVDLTPEEFHGVFNDAPETHDHDAQPVPPVRVLLSAHLGQRQSDIARRYAANLAAGGKRVGLIQLDVSEFRITTFDHGTEPSPGASATGQFDLRAMRDAVNELNCDVDVWLLVTLNPRVAEARAVLRKTTDWVLLSACDHDGVVSAYRTLKGVADLGHPRLSLAAVDPKDPAEAEQVIRKLSSVCSQFLNWTPLPEPAVSAVHGVTECDVMLCRTNCDKAQLATTPHWQVVDELVSQARQALPVEERPTIGRITPETVAAVQPKVETQPDVEVQPRASSMKPAVSHKIAPALAPANDLPEVIDLPDDESSDSVITAVMKHAMGEVVETPIRPPMCPDARVAVTRDRRVILIAHAGRGLCALRDVGLAYRWMVENRQLLSMALPQFALDAQQTPHLRLLVDQSDLAAEVLQPLFQIDTVALRTYRRVRWGERVGLMLNAA